MIKGNWSSKTTGRYIRTFGSRKIDIRHYEANKCIIIPKNIRMNTKYKNRGTQVITHINKMLRNEEKVEREAQDDIGKMCNNIIYLHVILENKIETVFCWPWGINRGIRTVRRWRWRNRGKKKRNEKEEDEYWYKFVCQMKISLYCPFSLQIDVPDNIHLFAVKRISTPTLQDTFE